jgi:hypothetical protein
MVEKSVVLICLMHGTNLLTLGAMYVCMYVCMYNITTHVRHDRSLQPHSRGYYNVVCGVALANGLPGSLSALQQFTPGLDQRDEERRFCPRHCKGAYDGEVPRPKWWDVVSRVRVLGEN